MSSTPRGFATNLMRRWSSPPMARRNTSRCGRGREWPYASSPNAHTLSGVKLPRCSGANATQPPRGNCHLRAAHTQQYRPRELAWTACGHQRQVIPERSENGPQLGRHWAHRQDGTRAGQIARLLPLRVISYVGGTRGSGCCRGVRGYAFRMERPARMPPQLRAWFRGRSPCAHTPSIEPSGTASPNYGSRCCQHCRENGR